MKKKNGLLEMFLTLLKIGLFTFGGGYAMLALLESELVEKKKWIGKDEFLDMVAIAESTPGPIAINSATYIGYKRGRMLGSAIATTAICIPSFVIIYVISLFLDTFLTFTLVGYAFRGIQACVVYLILSAGLKMLKGVKKDAVSIAILISVLVCMVCFSVFAIEFSSIFYIIISGAIGIMLYFIRKIRSKEDEKK